MENEGKYIIVHYNISMDKMSAGQGCNDNVLLPHEYRDPDSDHFHVPNTCGLAELRVHPTAAKSTALCGQVSP